MLFLIFCSFLIAFLIGTFLLTGIISALRYLPNKESIILLRSEGKWFPYRSFHLYFFPKEEVESFYFSVLCALTICRFLYATAGLLLLAQTEWFWKGLFFAENGVTGTFNWFSLLCGLILFLLIAFIVVDYLPRILAVRFTKTFLNIALPLASPFLFLAFPFTYLFLKVSPNLSKNLSPSHAGISREYLLDLIQQAEVPSSLDFHDRKLIEAALNFRERVVREVMVPRVDIFSLPAHISIKTAAKLLEEEGYSRTPVYRNTVDNIVGVLMYKDILNKYMEYEEKGNHRAILEDPIEVIQKPVLHVPETKRLSSLLLEFRKKQVHLAIVVDEYGGTEGIVTIEDILEEIVGDIADEYDEEEALFYPQPDGSWIVDARMNILDIEDDLGIKIPQEAEYDTIGGYIFHTTGTIPSRGFIIHHNLFDIEILESNDRSVDRVRIREVKTNQNNANIKNLSSQS